MSNNDLIKWVTSDVDFYDLLGTHFEAPETELRRAYRKTALKYHPDKVGKDFDPAKYELFQAAYEVLIDPSLKSQYDNYRNAKILKKRANDLFDGKRRQMKEDLEAREKNGLSGLSKRPRNEDVHAESELELKRLAEEGRKRRAARAKLVAENSAPSQVPENLVTTPAQMAEPLARQTEEDEIERLEKKIREAADAKAKRRAERKVKRAVDDKMVSSKEDLNSLKDPNFTEEPATSKKKPPILKSSSESKPDFAVTMARLKAAQQSRLQSKESKQEL
ncbi:DnaJ domain containing protein/pre-mRNA-splicing factor cwc23 [Blumeria hordei DH14]|uniref:DnaJ domain containing protein/pre-mRNA-splicing factor cwc23 n=1 Tax=Blumeria graminis f. sp. hordei (strain DH14) TaxID=546991 RepID=N1JET5_BLUG1|nr:DnaJ domain containing protein/pre-mRNA-splicing factor cwc23 [Blumeria hordei DH14]